MVVKLFFKVISQFDLFGDVNHGGYRKAGQGMKSDNNKMTGWMRGK